MKNFALPLNHISESQVDKKLLWFSKQAPLVRQRVLQEVMDKNTDLISAITQIQNEIQLTTRRKNPDRDLEPMQEIHKLRLAKIHQNCKKKGKPKLQAIKKRFNTIRSLRAEKKSWRDIKEYLKRFCNIDVSYGYLRRAYNELCDVSQSEQKNKTK